MNWNGIEFIISLSIFNVCQDYEGNLSYSELNGSRLAGRNWVSGTLPE